MSEPRKMRDENSCCSTSATHRIHPDQVGSAPRVASNSSLRIRPENTAESSHFSLAIGNNTALVIVQVRTAHSDSHVVRFVVPKVQTPPTGYGHPSLAGLAKSVWNWQKLTVYLYLYLFILVASSSRMANHGRTPFKSHLASSSPCFKHCSCWRGTSIDQEYNSEDLEQAIAVFSASKCFRIPKHHKVSTSNMSDVHLQSLNY